MKSNLKSVVATAFLLICSISTINAQNNHQFSYQLREDGTHIYMSDESEFKIIEIDQREEIIYQGDFSLAYMEKDGYICMKGGKIIINENDEYTKIENDLHTYTNNPSLAHSIPHQSHQDVPNG